jgi:hypothetical protein
MDTPTVNFNVINQTTAVSRPVEGVSFFLGTSIRGPFNKPSEILSSWASFVRIYGGLQGGNPAFNLKRYFDKGGKARFARLGHYTDISDASTLVPIKAQPDTQIATAGEEEEPFLLSIKNPGTDGNNIVVEILEPTNGQIGFFDLNIKHETDTFLSEMFPNISIPSGSTIENSNYLKKVIESSNLVNVEYKTITEEGIITPLGNIVPITTSVEVSYTGGTDAAITDTDIIGDSSSRTGFYAFDEVEDSYQIMVLTDNVSAAVHTAGHAYAANRQDLQYWAAPNPKLVKTKAELIAFREATGMTTKFGAIFGGGLTVLNPVNSQIVETPGLADIAALAVNSEVAFGPWFSFSGNTRGLITNALGVTNNFGTTGSKGDLNELANRQVNMIINRDQQIKLWGGFSTQIKSDSESFISIVKLVMFIKKALRPTLENFLEEPTDIPTFFRMYHVVKPFFEELVNRRAIVSWDWRGDQFSSSPADFQINKAIDVALGKYKVQLVIVPIVGMQEITISMYLTADGELLFDGN